MSISIVTIVVGSLVTASVPAGVLGGLVWRGRDARRRLEQELASRRRAIANAEDRWAELGLSVDRRDQIVALKLRGPHTQAVVAEVTGALDRIRTGLDALTRRLDEVQRLHAGVLTAAAGRHALEALDAPFSYDTGAGTGLFESERRTTTIDPAAFASDLDAAWATARSGWARVLDAVDASMRNARDDAPLDDLLRMKRVLAAAGLPELWVADHPLASDPERTWTALDDLRRTDPVAYLDQLRRARAWDDALEGRICGLVGGRDAVREACAEADRIDVRPGDTGGSTEQDLRELRRDAVRTAAVMDNVLAAGEDAARAGAAIEAALVAARRLAALRLATSEAIRLAPGRVEDARERIASLEQKFAAANEALERALGVHFPGRLADARRELTEADEDVREARDALAEAEAALGRREHLRAVRLCERTLAERDEALVDLEQLRAALARADEPRQVADELLAEVVAAREIAGRLQQHVGGADLAAGDRRLAALRAEWDTPGDWTARVTELTAIQASWRAAQRAATSEWSKQEERRTAVSEMAREAERLHRESFESYRTGAAYRSTIDERSWL